MAAEIRLWRGAIVSSMCGKHCTTFKKPIKTYFGAPLAPQHYITLRKVVWGGCNGPDSEYWHLYRCLNIVYHSLGEEQHQRPDVKLVNTSCQHRCW